MKISIETRKGDYRRWYDPHEKREGKTLMLHDYGYIRGTLGTDGDHVDVYVGPDENAENVYIVDQLKAPDFTKFDEQKVMLGFASDTEARRAYIAHYNTSKFFGSLEKMSIKVFRDKVLSKDNHGEPIEKGLFIGPRGGRWLNPQRTIPYREPAKPRLRHSKTLEERIKRRGPGEGREAQLSREELMHVLSTTRFGIVSADPNPEYDAHKGMPLEEIKTRRKQLRAELVKGGFTFTPSKGNYFGREDSFLVMMHDADRNEVRRLGAMFQQDSVVYVDKKKNELHYTYGEKAKRNLCSEGQDWDFKPSASNLWTEIRHPKGGHTKFSLNLNMKETRQCEKAMTHTLEKARRPRGLPAGYEPAPRSKKGGWRKKVGGEYDYWYPGEALPGRRAASKPKKGSKVTVQRKGPQKAAVRVAAGIPLASFDDTRADSKTSPGRHKLESGKFKWMRSRTYELGRDGRKIRKTILVPGVDEHTKNQLISEFTPLVKSEAKKSMRLFGLKQRYAGGRDEVVEELQRGGVEGILQAIRHYKGNQPFAPVATQFVRDFVRTEASQQMYGGFDLPELHLRNLRRFIAARVQTRIKHQDDSPSAEKIAKGLDLRFKHVHKIPSGEFDITLSDGSSKTVTRNDLLPMKPYKLGIGRRRAKLEGLDPHMRDVSEQRSRVEWAETYASMLQGQQAATKFELDEVLSIEGSYIGAGLSTEDKVVIKDQITKIMRRVKGLGEMIIEKPAKGRRLVGTEKQAMTQYSVVDAAEVLSRRIGAYDGDEHSIRQLAEVVPVYRKDAKGEWQEVSERMARTMLQEFVDKGMARLKAGMRYQTNDETTLGIIGRAADLVAPKQGNIPIGPTYHERLKEMSKKFTAGQVEEYRQKQLGKLSRSVDATDDKERKRIFQRSASRIRAMGKRALALELARTSSEGQALSKEMREAMTRHTVVERVSERSGLMHVYDPGTKKHRSMKVHMDYDRDWVDPTPAGASLKKAFDLLSQAILREVQKWPETMELLMGDESTLTTLERLNLLMLTSPSMREDLL